MGCRQSIVSDRPLSASNVSSAPPKKRLVTQSKAGGPQKSGYTSSFSVEELEIVDETNVLETYFEEHPIPIDSELLMASYCNYPLMNLPNNSTYQGEWKHGKQEGYGKIIYSDHGVYIGYWKNGQASGFGTYNAGDNSSMVGSYYSGMFHEGRANGYGVFKFADGSSYRGMFYNDRRHGIGMETHSDGLQYIGPFVMGKKKGIGRLKCPNEEYFIGEFDDNEISGYGVYRWPDGRTYEGYWVMSVQEGTARFSWPDGRIYVGNYSKGKINDHGVLTWPDGRRYDGEWRNGLQEGYGNYYKNKTQYRSAVFVEGVRTRWESDFITLPEEAPLPVYERPNIMKGLNVKSVNNMESFLLDYLEARFNLKDIKDHVERGHLVDWKGNLIE